MTTPDRDRPAEWRALVAEIETRWSNPWIVPVPDLDRLCAALTATLDELARVTAENEELRGRAALAGPEGRV